MLKIKRLLKCNAAFSLAEILITIVVTTLVIKGVSMSTVNAIVLNEYNRGFSIAMNVARLKLEETIAKRSDFDSIDSVKGSLTKASEGIDGLYRIDVKDAIPGRLKDISVSVCWSGRGKRIIGHCKDTNNDGIVDGWKENPNPPVPWSPCIVSTAIVAR